VKSIDSIGTITVTLFEEQTTGHRIAVKFDTTGRSQSFNNEEINLKKIRQRNPDVVHVVQYLGSYVLPIAHNKFEYIEENVERYLEEQKGALEPHMVLKQMLNALREIHSLGYVHRDVRPSNFLIHNHCVKLVNFGCATDYRRDGNHNSHQNLGNYQGNPFFASIGSLSGFNAFRKDDLEQLGYSIMYLLDRTLIPWSNSSNFDEVK